MSSAPKFTAVIAGLGNGSGTGGSTARLFASKGFRVALIGRGRTSATQSSLDIIADQIKSSGGDAHAFTISAYDGEGLKGAFKSIEELWPKSVRFALFNAGEAVFGKLLDIDEDKLRTGVETNVIGAFTFGQEAVKAILAATGDAEEEAGHRGTIIYTGATAALRGGAGFGAFAAGKFGIRAVSQSIAREYGPRGIHTAHAIIDGGILTDRSKGYKDEATMADPRKLLNPDSIAKAYWFLHEQDPSAWTQELDLRPAHEKF